jgi:hypothetical protein
MAVRSLGWPGVEAGVAMRRQSDAWDLKLKAPRCMICAIL